MTSERRAVIDVGTNSIKLLVAECAGGATRPLVEESRQTRLGRGFFETRQLQPEAIRQSAEAVSEFAAVARRHGITRLRMIATSAARDALNVDELTRSLEGAAGVPLEIISGEQEAELAFRGVITDPALRAARLLIMDLGGGSTELVAASGAVPHLRHSFPLGTVRLLEKIPPSDPPLVSELAASREWVRDFLRTRVVPVVEPVLAQAAGADWRTVTILAGTGGTATLLGCMEARLERYDRARLDGLRLSRARARWHVGHLWSLPLAERQQVTGLPANRADIILMGAVIYEGVLECFDLPALRVSTRGLRWAAV